MKFFLCIVYRNYIFINDYKIKKNNNNIKYAFDNYLRKENIEHIEEVADLYLRL